MARLVSFTAVSISVGAFAGNSDVKDLHARAAFADFGVRFGREYKNLDESERRFEIFQANLEATELVNAQEKTYRLGVGPFADWTSKEFRQRRIGGYRPFRASSNHTSASFTMPAGGLPASVDWSADGAVTDVQDQGDCGDCWAFATTGLLEGAAKARGGTLTKLSEQMLVDCDDFASGCDGGGADLGVWWVEDEGLCSAEAYPYKSGTSGRAGSCKSCSNKVVKAGSVSDFSYVDETEAALQAAVSQQPVAVGIEADKAPIQHYTSGVVTGTGCGTDLDHNVLVVGYGELDGTKYWKVKNSWGPSWGMDGYFLLERGAAGKGGMCGILMNAVVPVFNSDVVV